MRMLNAFTLEVDDADVAVGELLDQLDLENTLGKHSAGFITCSFDFVETGMVEAVCKALPFDVVGCTTLTNAIYEDAGTMLLCLSVLTGDDCEFSTAVTESLEGSRGNALDTTIAAAWREASGRLAGPARFAIVFSPLIVSSGGEFVLESLNAASGGVPSFGITACDHDTADYSSSFTIHNGVCSRDRLSFLLVGGNVHPVFAAVTTAGDKIYTQQAVITASEGSIVQEINGTSARAFLQSIGLTKGDGVEGMISIPFIVDYNDGTQPVARAIYKLTDEGYAVCGGAMPKGGTLYVAGMDTEGILRSARGVLVDIMKDTSLNGLILFPCLGRNMVLASAPLAEVEAVRELVGNAVPWHLAYSGGEWCPVYTGDGTPVNRYHNFSFIACAF